ncbi:putative Asp-hemolysin [Lanmaoa asiatica]|nr:putative Asp-hemolysin [Lanmaoa asiatica]
MDIQSSPREWIRMQITNALGSETIIVRNPTLNLGEFLNDYPTREHYYGTAHNRLIYPGTLQIISACASKGYRGTSGTISLCQGYTLICHLYWDCPGGGRQNSLQEYDVGRNYSINIGAFNVSGPIGNVDITVQPA